MHEKLIRDKIPELAAARGEVLDVRVADEGEMYDLLVDKLVEEAAELRAARTDAEKDDELADVVEVVLALARARGRRDVYTLGMHKYGERGGFRKRLVLREEAGPTSRTPRTWKDDLIDDLRAIGVVDEVCLGCGRVDCDGCPCGTSTSVIHAKLEAGTAEKLRQIWRQRRTSR